MVLLRECTWVVSFYFYKEDSLNDAWITCTNFLYLCSLKQYLPERIMQWYNNSISSTLNYNTMYPWINCYHQALSSRFLPRPGLPIQGLTEAGPAGRSRFPHMFTITLKHSRPPNNRNRGSTAGTLPERRIFKYQLWENFRYFLF